MRDEAARAAGVEEFGISDHLVMGPREFYLDARLWSMGVNELSGYMADAQAVKAELDSPGFRVRIGLEVDYFPESVARRPTPEATARIRSRLDG